MDTPQKLGRGRWRSQHSCINGVWKKALLTSLGSLTLLMFPCPATADEGTVEVTVSELNSTLNYTVTFSDLTAGANIPSTNFRIRGAILLSKGGLKKSVLVSVSTLRLLLQQGSDNLVVNLGGSIGNLPPSTTPIPIDFSSKEATIDLIGDLDESALSLTTGAGLYQGTLIITAVSL